MAVNKVTKEVDAEANIRRCKNTISSLRKQLSDKSVVRSQEMEQQIHDKIKDLQREMEGYRKNTRVIKPIVNAPIVSQRSSRPKQRRSHFTIA